ncbi:hypothetical protein [Rhizobium oryzihabitans]
MAFASRNAFFKRKNTLFSARQESTAPAEGGLRRGRNRDGKTAAAIYAS